SQFLLVSYGALSSIALTLILMLMPSHRVCFWALPRVLSRLSPPVSQESLPQVTPLITPHHSRSIGRSQTQSPRQWPPQIHRALYRCDRSNRLKARQAFRHDTLQNVWSFHARKKPDDAHQTPQPHRLTSR